MSDNKLLSPNSSTFFLLISILLYSLGFWYLSFYNLPKGDFYIPNDEFMIPDSGVFAWYGLPSRCLEWPASPMVLFYYLLIGFFALKSFLVQFFSGSANSNIFEIFDKVVYNYLMHKADYLVYGRVFQYLSVVVLSYFSFQNLKKSTIFKENQFALIIFFLILLGTQTLISTSSMVRPDAIAILVTVYFFSITFSKKNLSVNEKISIVICFALMVSFRTVYLFLLPYFIYVLFRKNKNVSWKDSTLFLLLFLVLLFALNPYFLSNSFLFIKAFFGNILSKRHQAMESLYNNQFIFNEIKQNLMIPVYIIFALLGLQKLWKTKAEFKIEIALLVVFTFIYLHASLHSPVVFTTHIAPVLPFFYLLVSIGLSNFLDKNKVIFLGIFSLILLSNFYINFQGSRKGKTTNYYEAINYIKSIKSSNSLAIPEHWDVFFAENRSKASFDFEFNLLNSSSKRSRKLNKLLANTDSTKNAYNNMLLRSFMFDEENIKSAAAFICKAQTTDNEADKNMIYLFDDNSEWVENAIVPLHCLNSSEIDSLVNENKIELILTKNQRNLSHFQLIKEFSNGVGEKYFVYRKRP